MRRFFGNWCQRTIQKGIIVKYESKVIDKGIGELYAKQYDHTKCIKQWLIAKQIASDILSWNITLGLLIFWYWSTVVIWIKVDPTKQGTPPVMKEKIDSYQ